MKTRIYSLLLAAAFLSGCSTSYTYSSKKVTVNKTDGGMRDYALLSVRGDSAIVVLDWAEAHVYPLPFSHAEILQEEAIKNIVREGKGGGINSTVGGLACAAAGGITAYTLFPFTANIYDVYLFFIPELVHVMAIAAGVSIGAFIGSSIGDAFPPNIYLTLSSAQDRNFLHSIALYPDKEPEIMDYIK
ncbi:MAG: hypothetical protein ACHQM6_03290 [Candidatus Kapaibacterium sp.]